MLIYIQVSTLQAGKSPIYRCLRFEKKLGGGFKHVLFSPLYSLGNDPI